MKLQKISVGNSIWVKSHTGNMQPSKAIFKTVTIDEKKIKKSKLDDCGRQVSVRGIK